MVEICHMIGVESMDTILMGELVAKVINIVVIVPINFLINKYWAYKQKN